MISINWMVWSIIHNFLWFLAGEAIDLSLVLA